MPSFEVLKRFIRFGIVGMSGVVVDMAVLFLIADPKTLAWDISVAKTIAAETAIINNFVWNDLWTFNDLSSGQFGLLSRIARFWKFNVICLAGIVLSLILLNIQVRGLNWNIYVANFISIFLVSFWNFWMSTKFGWKKLA